MSANNARLTNNVVIIAILQGAQKWKSLTVGKSSFSRWPREECRNEAFQSLQMDCLGRHCADPFQRTYIFADQILFL
jgi:hypothetical protein